MRILLQRVKRAEVRVVSENDQSARITGRIDTGFLLLVGFTHGDSKAEIDWMADKVLGLRLFPDADGKLNRDIGEANGALLVVSQFTLYADARKGRRPSFVDAARPDSAVPLYNDFVEALRARNVSVATGEFGATMEVNLVNDGPVTIWLEREPVQGTTSTA